LRIKNTKSRSRPEPRSKLYALEPSPGAITVEPKQGIEVVKLARCILSVAARNKNDD
jgi:hypothetical protein